jgi:hypothetical protein
VTIARWSERLDLVKKADQSYIAIRVAAGDPEVPAETPTGRDYRPGTPDMYYWVQFDPSGAKPLFQSRPFATPEAAEDDANAAREERVELAGLAIRYEFHREHVCDAVDRSTGARCQRGAHVRAARRKQGGSGEDLLLCRRHYEAFRLEGMVQGMRPI